MQLEHKTLKIIFVGGLVLLVLIVGIFLLNVVNQAKDIAGKAISDVCATDADCGSADLECKNGFCAEKVFVVQIMSCADDGQGTVTFNKEEYKNQCVDGNNNLKKYSCSNKQLVLEIYKCSKGCDDTANACK
ncbi:hypothetical protein HZA96_03730 [Candidatus Woesearchaeota archaeon]|nr:hypothetical protein [Candidatus Woesearchaeota archaeon]